MVLKDLTQLRGVSGDEREVRDYILDALSAMDIQHRVDRIGNVIAFKKGTARTRKHVLMAAHMDEIGMIVCGINDAGLLAYMTVGGIDPRVMVSKRVLVGKKALPGVIGAKAIHLQSKEELARPLTHDDLYIDIGAKDKKAAEAMVELGDYVSLSSDYIEFGDGCVKAKALDDRLGCYNMLRLLGESHANDLSCAFTVQEEIGLHGAQVAGQQLDVDCAVVLESTSANDLGDVPDHLRVCAVGQGIAISFMDRASIAHRGLNEQLRTLATEQKIPWQVKTFVSGGNDAGALQTARGATPTCVLSVPCRNIHSHSNVASLSDIEAQYALAKALLNAKLKIGGQ